MTVAVNGFSFHLPVKVGDEVTCYTEIIKRGRTSLTLDVQAWVCRQDGGAKIKVTEGVFVFVALDAEGGPAPCRPSFPLPANLQGRPLGRGSRWRTPEIHGFPGSRARGGGLRKAFAKGLEIWFLADRVMDHRRPTPRSPGYHGVKPGG